MDNRESPQIGEGSPAHNPGPFTPEEQLFMKELFARRDAEAKARLPLSDAQTRALSNMALRMLTGRRATVVASGWGSSKKTPGPAAEVAEFLMEQTARAAGVSEGDIQGDAERHFNSPAMDKRARPVEAMPFHQIISVPAMHRLVDASKMRENAESLRLVEAIEQMAAGDGKRPAGQTGTAEAVFALESRFPNFAEVIRDVAVQVDFVNAARAAGELVFLQLPPMLLWGEPGTGKSSFLEALAEALQAPFFPQPCHASLPAHTFTGVAAGYQGAMPGRVFDAVVSSPIATPMFVLDEIDKLGYQHQYSPLGAMLAILEPVNSRRFRDDFLGEPFDASRMLIAATANDPNSIPEPLMSRLLAYRIRPPTEEQMRQIGRQIYAATLRERGLNKVFEAEPGLGFIESIVAGDVRDLKKTILRGLISARYAGRRAPIAFDAMDALRAKCNNAPPFPPAGN